ncbi:hypothetical protein CS063_14570 [Sporanaerobium hydrogeniformans]|uniref:Uncharacterized protein n=1 Tax=Sporanaerobium hydrogeniformans TaxID=3072179 RepID=A0AC61DAC1_9FIRM|nr:uroporphyrinogen decarboxylase family protein [Sporanaerobium hydrogeniformans]PHV69643.1 hypothetical protein CS063_14570 [Sporanaerobium hydrogeniformans]
MYERQQVLKPKQDQEIEEMLSLMNCHVASLIKVDSEKYFKCSDYIVQGAIKVSSLYCSHRMPILYDLQLEAEALGCKLTYTKDKPPRISNHILEEGTKLEDLRVPTEKEGRFPIVLEATKEIVKAFGKEKAIYGLVTGPFTLALHLRGVAVFYDLLDEPEEVECLMTFCQKVVLHTAQMYINLGVDNIALVDPMAFHISKAHFENFVEPYITPIFECIKEQGKRVNLIKGDKTSEGEIPYKFGMTTHKGYENRRNILKGELTTVNVDCITFDSESCVVSQYTMEAVYTAAALVGKQVKVIEHKMKDSTPIPIIYVEGEVKYSHYLPDIGELVDCFRAALRVKQEEKSILKAL